MRAAADTTSMTLIGHPYATVGMGEQLRSHIAACKSVDLEHGVLDIFRYSARTDPDYRNLVGPVETNEPAGMLREVLRRHAARVQLASQRELEDAKMNVSYRLLLRDPSRARELLADLRATPGVELPALFHREDESEL